MIPPILRARDGTKVKVDTKTVLAGPFDRFHEAGPTDLREERLSGIEFDGPERKGNYPLRTGRSDLSEVFLCDERLIMVLDGAEVAVTCLDESMESPFVDGVGIEWLIEGRSDEGSDDQPASELTVLGRLAIIS
jgi:hypothetical protein